PVASASVPMVRPSSPALLTRRSASSRIAARVRSPFVWRDCVLTDCTAMGGHNSTNVRFRPGVQLGLVVGIRVLEGAGGGGHPDEKDRWRAQHQHFLVEAGAKGPRARGWRTHSPSTRASLAGYGVVGWGGRPTRAAS